MDDIIRQVSTNEILKPIMNHLLKYLPPDLQNKNIVKLIEISLLEDLGLDSLPDDPHSFVERDVTSTSTLDGEQARNARIFTRQEGVVAGLPVAQAVFALVDPAIEFHIEVGDGSFVEAGKTLATLCGPVAALLAAERTALNFLGRMCGIATRTAQFVEQMAGTGAVILDTRKTLPGFRLLDKYSVRMGGGQNHRMGLYDMVLIKNNHIDAVGDLPATVRRVRDMFGNRYPIEVEVRDLEELRQALELQPDRILLDNMSLDMMRTAVEMSGERVHLEASGNVNLNTVRSIAETGVDYISSGAITHSVTVLDISMHMDVH